MHFHGLLKGQVFTVIDANVNILCMFIFRTFLFGSVKLTNMSLF